SFAAQCASPFRQLVTGPGCGTQGSSNLVILVPVARSMIWSMAQKTDAYIDSSALIAFLDRSDSYHPLFRKLFSKPPGLVTSALVAAEAHGWFLRRYDIHRGVQFLAFLDSLPGLKVLPFGGEELIATARIVKKYADQKLTLADAHGLVVMRDRRI